MSFHESVRGLLNRLAATILVACLASPGAEPGLSSRADERGSSSVRGQGLKAPSGPIAAAAVSVVPGAVSVPVPAAARVVLAIHRFACGRPVVRALLPPDGRKSAPAVLRL